jgi:hypothetical protein
MDVGRARAVLGVSTTATWGQVRAAYRTRIAAAHPDRAGGSTAEAARLNDAYTTLARARRAGTLHDAPHTGPGEAPARPAGRRRDAPEAGPSVVAGPGVPPEVLDGDTIHLAMPADEAFVRLVEACHHIGDVTYVDRSCAILEALVRVEGEGVCSLVITLQGRATGTDAFCTLEAIERVASPPVGPVVTALVDALRS